MTSLRQHHEKIKEPARAKAYADYQARFAHSPKECDKHAAWLVLSAVRGLAKPRILDIGCNTGNFLRLLKANLPDADLWGGDIVPDLIEMCRQAPDLEGVRFEVMNIFDLHGPFDVITGNAVNFNFEPDEYRASLVSIAKALKPGGHWISYEYVFPDDRQQKVVETSQHRPDGLTLFLRSAPFVRQALRDAGFADIEVDLFNIPIDLPKPDPTGTDADLITYTVKDETGFRHQYRGGLYQPWAHVRARRQ